MRQPTETIGTRDDADVLRAAFDRGDELTKEVAQARYGWGDRRFRSIVEALRDEGYPVVSFSEHGSTYRKAASAAEADRFVDEELVPRIRKLERRARRIRESKPIYFGVQQRLI